MARGFAFFATLFATVEALFWLWFPALPASQVVLLLAGALLGGAGVWLARRAGTSSALFALAAAAAFASETFSMVLAAPPLALAAILQFAARGSVPPSTSRPAATAVNVPPQAQPVPDVPDAQERRPRNVPARQRAAQAVATTAAVLGVGEFLLLLVAFLLGSGFAVTESGPGWLVVLLAGQLAAIAVGAAGAALALQEPRRSGLLLLAATGGLIVGLLPAPLFAIAGLLELSTTTPNAPRPRGHITTAV